jgi:ABC-type glutathione transport system ATPase component
VADRLRTEGLDRCRREEDRRAREEGRALTPSLHAADSHDLIRVQGARVNNLKDVSIEIPKRRLTVFTGVSGSGKSSLVFGTIAAESQRMINETYSAFVQGFMPTQSRPEVDLLERLTTAIIVDQERMGSNPAPPSAPPPTPTRCCASSSAGSGSRISARPTRTRSTSPR